MAESWDKMREELSAICPTSWNAVDFDTEIVGQLLKCRDEIGEGAYVMLVEKLDHADTSTKLITIFEVLRVIGKTIELRPSHPEAEPVRFHFQSAVGIRFSNEDQSRIDEMMLLVKITSLLSFYRAKLGDDVVEDFMTKIMKHNGPQLRLVFDVLKLADHTLAIVPMEKAEE